MQFQVPQFIEVEDKIFGPLTFKQFAYLAGTAGISVMLYAYLPFFIAVLFILPIAGLGLALAFYRYNGRPFIMTLEAAIRYSLSKRLYVWKRGEKKAGPIEKTAEQAAEELARSIVVPRLSESKLKDLAWGLDVHKNVQ